ncbi:hypothetical protein GCM10023172_11050 [Hymenobacter ginsengisoli]|uniref:histidine kinase n=1 Tax=Hymenobacter ginsengisoli TaxID=1051626 RepID=A0ABP8Q4G2_9BACT|nr:MULTISPECIES: PAS domain-containing protein [unclassified Hymenobacter]MBO2031691.1 PAS domain-containing protein [Hymenobacter sp. BT559]
MPDSPTPTAWADDNPAELVDVLLNVSLTGVILFRPVYDAAGQAIVDLAYEHLNPAAQQMLRLPACPPESFLTLFPMAAQREGVFAFYRDTFLSGQLARHEFNYQHDGLDGYFHLTAQRQGQRLVVSFTDTNDQSRSAVEEALRASQGREQAARAEAEVQRQRLLDLITQAPALIALLEGPTHIFELANQNFQRVFGLRELLGRPYGEAAPELVQQGFLALLDHVYRTGETYYGKEAAVELADAPEPRYFDFIYQATRGADGRINGILNMAHEVTEQVRARQQVEQLNQELEARVQRRTSQLAEQQQLLRLILGQVPAAVAAFVGPEHRFSFTNEAFERLTGGRAKLGASIAEALPELQKQGFIDLLNRVYTTGEPYTGQEVAVKLTREGQAATLQYFNFTCQAMPNEGEHGRSILVFAVDVTEQVLARRQAATLQAAMLAAAQRQAQQRQELYQVFEQTPVAIVLLREPEHRIDYFNPAFCDLFPPEDWSGSLQGHKVEEVYPRLKVAGLTALLDNVFATGEPQTVLDMPLAELQPDSPRYVTLAYQAYREQGRIVGVAAFIYDVTEQVEARRASEASAHRLQLLTDALPVLISYVDRDHRYQFVNQAYHDWFGLSTAELLGRSAREAIGERAYAATQPYMDRALRGEAVTFEALMPYRNGLTKYIRTNYIPDKQQGEVAGFYALVSDVSEQVLAHQQLQEQQANLQVLFEQAPVAICVFQGSDYRLELVNPLMGEMLGRSPLDLLGRPFFEAFPELVDQGLRQLLDGVRRTRTPFQAHSQAIRLARHLPGEVGYFDFVYQPLHRLSGELAVVCVATDVTAQVLARQQVQTLNEELAAINEEMQVTNEELHESNARLTRTNAELDTFVYTASHDLKSPITNVEGLLLALRSELPPTAQQVEPIPTLLDMMQGAVQRFQQTLAHLTDISRLQQDVLEQHAEAVDLPALVEAVRLDILPELTFSGATLDLELAECPALRLPARSLRSILYNLLSNAIKYRDSARPLHIGLSCRSAGPGKVALAVQDNGLGLDQGQQDQLFRLFRRLHSHVSGSGVGLYMVKRLIDNLGGTLAVQSEPGVGSIFTVTLPTLSPA